MCVCVSEWIQLNLSDWEPFTLLSAFCKRTKVGQKPIYSGDLPSLFMVYLCPAGHAGADGDGAAHVPPERVHVPQDARGCPEQPAHAGHGRAQQ